MKKLFSVFTTCFSFEAAFFICRDELQMGLPTNFLLPLKMFF